MIIILHYNSQIGCGTICIKASASDSVTKKIMTLYEVNSSRGTIYAVNYCITFMKEIYKLNTRIYQQYWIQKLLDLS